MAQYPSDLKSEYQISFGWAMMPDQTQSLTDYRQKATSSRPGGAIFLPLPDTIEDTSTHTWNLSSGIGSKALSTLIEGFKSSADLATFGAASAYMEATGANVDPNHFYTYQQSEPRAFNYSIKMVPRNAGEAAEIADIVKKFKKYSSPDKDSGTFVKNYKWGIEFGNDKLNEMTKFNIKPWVLLNVTTSYTDGKALFFDDGMPKSVILTLSFAEMEVIYDADW